MRLDDNAFALDKIDLLFLDESADTVSQCIKNFVFSLTDPLAISMKAFDLNAKCCAVSSVAVNI